MITGKDLIAAGATPGKWFSKALEAINSGGFSIDEAIAALAPPSVIPLQEAVGFHKNIAADNDHEQANVEAVFDTMRALMQTPVVRAGAVMPDACPAGPLGTIPVGGVVASEALHPGMHSADICCSMAITVFATGCDPKALLDTVQAVTHFGPGGRADAVGKPPHLDPTNPFLRDAAMLSDTHFATQGDGNHFAYVGLMASTGALALVTHHGSRGPGAAVYKAGMRVAEKFRQQISPETLKQNAWIPVGTREGADYWCALQTIREWTKHSHFAIHDMAAKSLGLKIADRFWNEHNFVFLKSDGLFYHAKGATPAFDGWADDATDLTIIPMNMAEPILITRGRNADNGLGFAPHGAGRNFSRTQHKRALGDRSDEDIFAEETQGIDARFFMGAPDVSELPSAYKNAAAVRAQINQYGLADIVDEVLPYGCIMAGDWERDMPWRKRK